MLELDDKAFRAIERQFFRAADRAEACVAHYRRTGKAEDRIEALFAIGEASGLRNVIRLATREFATVANTMSALMIEYDYLKYADFNQEKQK